MSVTLIDGDEYDNPRRVSVSRRGSFSHGLQREQLSVCASNQQRAAGTVQGLNVLQEVVAPLLHTHKCLSVWVVSWSGHLVMQSISE